MTSLSAARNPLRCSGLQRLDLRPVWLRPGEPAGASDGQDQDDCVSVDVILVPVRWGRWSGSWRYRSSNGSIGIAADRVGALNRDDNWWVVKWHDPEQWRRGASAYRFAFHYDRRGRPDGYVAFRVKNKWEESGSAAEVIIDELDASNAKARAALWRFVLDLDLVRTFSMDSAPDEPLRYFVNDLRSVKTTCRTERTRDWSTCRGRSRPSLPQRSRRDHQG